MIARRVAMLSCAERGRSHPVNAFQAFRIHDIDGKVVARFEEITLEQLSPGDVVIDVQYSDINYKDALAATGAGKILRRYPLVGGIDLAGVVRSAGDRQRPVGNGGRRLRRAGTGQG